MQYGNESDTSYRIWAEGRFKSYYVVWKQVMVDAKAKKKEGLNRTMQYGNRVRITAHCLKRRV